MNDKVKVESIRVIFTIPRSIYEKTRRMKEGDIIFVKTFFYKILRVEETGFGCIVECEELKTFYNIYQMNESMTSLDVIWEAMPKM